MQPKNNNNSKPQMYVILLLASMWVGLHLHFVKLRIEFMHESVFYIALSLKTLPVVIEVLAELLETDLRLLAEAQVMATTPPDVLHLMKNWSRWSKQ